MENVFVFKEYIEIFRGEGRREVYWGMEGSLGSVSRGAIRVSGSSGVGGWWGVRVGFYFVRFFMRRLKSFFGVVGKKCFLIRS